MHECEFVQLDSVLGDGMQAHRRTQPTAYLIEAQISVLRNITLLKSTSAWRQASMRPY